MARISLQNSEIYYEIHGPEAAPVVALANGIFADTSNWAVQAQTLTGQYRVLTFDFAGQGKSLAATEPISPAQQAEIFTALLSELRIDELHYIGISYGGEVGLSWAIQQPMGLKSLILADCVASIHPHLDARVTEWISVMRAGDPDKLFEISAPDIFSQNYFEANRALMDAVRQSYNKLNLSSLLYLLENYQKFDLSDQLGRISVPTLLLCGQEDRLKPPSVMAQMKHVVPNSEFIVIPEAGHALHMEKPHEFMTCVLGFLSKLEARPGRLN